MNLDWTTLLAALGGLGWFVLRPLLVSEEEKDQRVTDVGKGEKPAPPGQKDKPVTPVEKDKPDDSKKDPPKVPAGEPVGLTRLRREDIPAHELAAAGGGDPKQAPAELVAIFGSSRLSHWNLVRALAFHPNGETLASVSTDGTLKIWDAKTGDELHTLGLHRKPVRAVAFSPSGYRLATGSTDQTIRLWDTTNGAHIKCISQRAGGIYDLAYSPDGKTLASGHGDGAIRVWTA